MQPVFTQLNSFHAWSIFLQPNRLWNCFNSDSLWEVIITRKAESWDRFTLRGFYTYCSTSLTQLYIFSCLNLCKMYLSKTFVCLRRKYSLFSVLKFYLLSCQIWSNELCIGPNGSTLSSLSKKMADLSPGLFWVELIYSPCACVGFLGAMVLSHTM